VTYGARTLRHDLPQERFGFCASEGDSGGRKLLQLGALLRHLARLWHDHDGLVRQKPLPMLATQRTRAAFRNLRASE